jgi:hypothetical protein
MMALIATTTQMIATGVSRHNSTLWIATGRARRGRMHSSPRLDPFEVDQMPLITCIGRKGGWEVNMSVSLPFRTQLALLAALC